MPLQNDGNYRGRHACHVEPHPKLGSHRTLIHAAFDLVCALIDRDDVRKVDLGRLAHAGSGEFKHRCECTIRGQRVYLLLVTTAAAQAAVVKTTSPQAAHAVVGLVTAQWLQESFVSEVTRSLQFARQQ